MMIGQWRLKKFKVLEASKLTFIETVALKLRKLGDKWEGSRVELNQA